MIKSRNRIFTFDDFVSEERRKYLIVVIYDIIDNKRRARFAKYLLGFGERVQKSAFECILTSAKYEVLYIWNTKIYQGGRFCKSL
jgi:CRISPR-associated protein Cas2